MWSSVCESSSSSASLLLRSSISCSSRSMTLSARLTADFSCSLIRCVTLERIFSMERNSSIKILSLSSTAVSAERCIGHTSQSALTVASHGLWLTIGFSGTERAPALEESLNFCSSPNSPYETQQPLSTPQDLSLSAVSSAGTFSVALLKSSVWKLNKSLH